MSSLTRSMGSVVAPDVGRLHHRSSDCADKRRVGLRDRVSVTTCGDQECHPYLLIDRRQRRREPYTPIPRRPRLVQLPLLGSRGLGVG